MITEELLKQIYPFSKQSNRIKYLPYFNIYLPDYEVNTKQRMCAYFAQIGVESDQLNYCEEIASGKAYEGRKDLGNTEVGDGVKFKGRGLIQVTGKINYQKISKIYHVDFVSNPELLSTPEWAVKSSFWFWEDKELNTLADQEKFELITRKINGGLTGYKERLELYEQCKININEEILTV